MSDPGFFLFFLLCSCGLNSSMMYMAPSSFSLFSSLHRMSFARAFACWPPFHPSLFLHLERVFLFWPRLCPFNPPFVFSCPPLIFIACLIDPLFIGPQPPSSTYSTHFRQGKIEKDKIIARAFCSLLFWPGRCHYLPQGWPSCLEWEESLV